jgi:hypothetical protein
MPRNLKTVVAAAALLGGLLAAPALYAHRTDGSGMMGGMMQGRQGDMGQGGMMEGTMDMMSQMSGMMEHCNEMMQGTGDHESGAQRPNEQWGDRQSAPQDHPLPQAPDR